MESTKQRKGFLRTAIPALVLGLVMIVLGALTLTGCGTAYGEEAIVISSYEELKEFLDTYAESEYIYTQFSDTASNGKDYYVVLDADIDCNGEVLTPLLSADYIGLTFTFDGNGHTISNFKLDSTSVRYVGTATGSSTGVFATLALFPKSEGGQLIDITFEKVTYELGESYFASSDYNAYTGYGLKVGIVGYSRSSGSAVDYVDAGYAPSYYENVTIKDMTVSIDVGSSNTSAIDTTTEFPFAIGALIGIDADTTQYGTPLSSSSSMAERKNITVDNFTVNLTLPSGAVYVGGVVGHSNWQRVTYSNCTVKNSTFNINNGGNDYVENSTYTIPNKGTDDAAILGSTVSVGGIIGGSNKPQHEIVIKDCSTAIAYNITSGDTNGNLVQAGTMIGLLLETGESDELHIVTLTSNTGNCTLALNGAQATEVSAEKCEK